MIHLVRNKGADKRAEGMELKERAMDQVVDDSLLKRLAEVSEEENFALKNRYRHQRQTMDYADKKRMPIDERNVRDLLRNQHIFRAKAVKEVNTYTEQIENPQFEYGLLQYLSEGSYGDLQDLVREVGIKRDTIPFFNMRDYRKTKDNMLQASDAQFKYLIGALFTPLNMTDYETSFVGWNEQPGMLPLSKPNWLTEI